MDKTKITQLIWLTNLLLNLAVLLFSLHVISEGRLFAILPFLGALTATMFFSKLLFSLGKPILSADKNVVNYLTIGCLFYISFTLVSILWLIQFTEVLKYFISISFITSQAICSMTTIPVIFKIKAHFLIEDNVVNKSCNVLRKESKIMALKLNN